MSTYTDVYTHNYIHITDDLHSRFIAFLDAKPKTVETYTRALRQFFVWLTKNGITKPERSDILAYRDELKTRTKPATVQNYVTVVRLFFKWTEAEGIYKNVAAHIKGAKIDGTHKKDPLTISQVQAVVSGIDRTTLKGARDYAILLLMISGGLRVIEVVRADIADFRTVGNSMRLFVQGKGKDEKIDIEIAESVENAIREYLAKIPKKEKGQALFMSVARKNKGERLKARSVSRIIKERLVFAGYDDSRLTAHSLRHTCATQAILAGVSLERVQEHLRHNKITTTQIYTHALKRADNHTAAVVASALFG
ncbi:integrase [Clostridia bacterium]|nr:integrase [Clostridia bacterium]